MNNVEKLRNYFLGKDPQLKETMADNSLRLIGIEGKHFVLRTEMLKKLIELKKQVDDQDEELQDDIDQLILDLADEARIREETDLALDGNFNLLDGEVSDLRGVVNGIKATVPYTALTQDIRIYEDNPVIAGLSGTGWYYTGEHEIYYEDSVEPVCKENTILYYSDDGEDKYLTFFPATMTNGYEILKTIIWWSLDENKWISDGWWVTYDLSPDSTDNQIPTARAVAQTLTDNFQVKLATVLADNVALADGAATTLPVGLYYTDTHYVSVNNNPEIGRGSFFYVENSNQLYSLDMKLLTVSKSVSYNTGSHEWSVTNRQFLLTSQISTTIDDTSSNNEVASAKAVYDNSLEVYSTTEQRIGTWIDSKPLYQKVITGTLPDFTTTTLNNDIVIDTNATNIIVKTAQVKRTNNNIYPFSSVTYRWDDDNLQNNSVGLSYSIRNNNTVRITQYDTTNNGGIYTLIVCYTKTTD